jgi:hypothetical protein
MSLWRPVVRMLAILSNTVAVFILAAMTISYQHGWGTVEVGLMASILLAPSTALLTLACPPRRI